MGRDRRGAMYISRIRLRNIRCIDNLEIDLRSRATTNSALLLLGNNGVGKSTILKSIALGLCDGGGASGLLTDMYGNLLKNGQEKGLIELHLSSGREKYRLTTTIERVVDDPGQEVLKKKIPKDFPWKQVFVCGYGPGRVMQGTHSYAQYETADAVYSLFNYGYELQNPELVVRRRVWGKRAEERKLFRILSDLLTLTGGDVSLSRTGITARSRAGDTVGIGALADGHRSTLNWILDLIGWTYLSGRKEPHGIVLIDEIENHLHPTWQRQVLRLLSKHFPLVQFIATSHSVLPAAGVYESKWRGLRIGKAHVLRMDSFGQITGAKLPPLDGWAYDRILESHAFDTPARSLSLEDAQTAVESAYSGPKSRRTQKFKDAMRKLRSVSKSDAVATQDRRVAKELNAELELLLKKRKRK